MKNEIAGKLGMRSVNWQRSATYRLTFYGGHEEPKLQESARIARQLGEGQALLSRARRQFLLSVGWCPAGPKVVATRGRGKRVIKNRLAGRKLGDAVVVLPENYYMMNSDRY